MKKNLMQDTNQLSFFDAIDKALKAPINAFCMLTNKSYRVHELEPWMAKIIPSGEYYILCVGHPLVLCETKEKIEPEMLYRHYRIGEKIYAATGVGGDKDIPEDKDNTEKELPETSTPFLYEVTDTGARLVRSLIKTEDNSFRGVEYVFGAEIDKRKVSEGLETTSFLDFWNQKAKEVGAPVLVYDGLNGKEARSFVQMGRFPFVNDMTSHFASYFTEKAFPSVYVLDFEKNI